MGNNKKYELDELLKDITEDNKHEEILIDLQGKEFPLDEYMAIRKATTRPLKHTLFKGETKIEKMNNELLKKLKGDLWLDV